MSIAVMASGNLGFQILKHLEPRNIVSVVFTDKKSDGIIDWAETKGIPCFAGNPRAGKASEFIADKKVEVLLSVNYLFIIEKDLIDWPIKAAVNLHGSLLPKYRGRTPHVWAIINNETETGVTAHLITEGCDEGRIIKQLAIPIGTETTGAEILSQYVEHYPQLVDDVLDCIESGTFEPKVQDETLATYFGKRTPDDGEINWDWQKERIRNWVRAQANPYPGAFTWIGKEKVIIDKVELDEFGFHQEMENGAVLSVDPLRVKTSNGALRVTSMRNTDLHITDKMKFENHAN